jgi:hypothetical protein
MTTDPHRPHVVARVPTEFEAAVIVSALEAAGIKAMAVGGPTAGFRAEAPGDVAVVVPENEAEQAEVVLVEFRSK